MNIGDAAHSQADVMRRLRELEGLVAELVAGRRLANASVGEGGIRIHGGGGLRVHQGGGITVEDGGDIDVIEGGDLNVSGGGGFNLSGGGDISLTGGGSLTIGDGGDITVNDGGNIRVNDGGDIAVSEGSLRILSAAGTFLANVVPVDFAVGYETESNFGYTTSLVPRASVDLAVPSWADEALVVAMCYAQGVNDDVVSHFIRIRPRIEGVDLEAAFGPEADPGGFGMATVQGATVVNNPDSTITVSTVVNVSSPWSADINNIALTTVFAIYRRAQ